MVGAVKLLMVIKMAFEKSEHVVPLERYFTTLLK